LFTAYFKGGEIITERFYYKKGDEEALLSGNMFLSQPNDIPDNTVLNYLSDIAGHEDIFFEIQDSPLTWSNPEKIMETLKKHAEPFIKVIDSTYKDNYGDESYYTLEFRLLYEREQNPNNNYEYNGSYEDDGSDSNSEDPWGDDDYPFNTQWYRDRYENR
jgi:hypothetical protein